MTILRRIRHALFASIAAFLLAVVFIPTDEPRTVWSVTRPNASEAPQVLVAAGPASGSIQSQSRLPKVLTARLRWRLLMTQHYADQDITRQFSQAVAAVDDSDDAPPAPEGVSMTLTSYRSDADSATESENSDTAQASADTKEPLTGHQFWSRQHDRAAVAYDKLLSLDKPSVVASPIASLPGLPTTRGILLAVLSGLLGGTVMVGVDWFAYRPQPLDTPSAATTLLLPASWFRVQRTPLQRFTHLLRTLCLLWIFVAGLVLLASSRKELGYERLTKWPLAELADLV